LDISQLRHLIEDMPSYRELLGDLREGKNNDFRIRVLDAAKPYLIAALYQNLKLPVLVITAQPDNAKKLFEQISLWGPFPELDIFPEPDTLPYQRTIADFTVEQERLRILFSLSRLDRGKAPPLIITSAPSIIQKIPSPDNFATLCHNVESGSDIDPLSLMARWESMGYRVENMVELPGTISRRGGIIDIFPPTSDLPARLEFFGNTIESMRLFDPATQRSQKVLSSLQVCPATDTLPLMNQSAFITAFKGLELTNCSPEIREQYARELSMISAGQRPPDIAFYAPLFNSGSLVDYLPPATIVIMDENAQISEEIHYLVDQAEELRSQRIVEGELPTNFPRPHFNWEEIDSRQEKNLRIMISSWDTANDSGQYLLDFAAAPSYAGQLTVLLSRSRGFLEEGYRLIFISNQASRLSELLEAEDIYAPPAMDIKGVPPPGTITVLQGSLSDGWISGKTYLLTDREIFGFIKERRLLKRRQGQRYKLLVDIQPGDYVVHIEHGIAQFAGLTTMSTDNTLKEYLILTYAAGDKLYVPTDQIDRISRYVGAGEDAPALSRLGTQEWNRTKLKVKESVEEIAQDLLHLYAAREVVSGFAFSPDTVWQRELEASFPYIETPDQVKVQEEVKEDMSKPRPMDRLVVGDVGYGKTEIAIRAAFKAVMDNKQVAMLVPTTVLAEQHYLTFKQRMGAFPIKIEVLSRFRTQHEQQDILESLASGSLDICIGTHRLLQKDVIFKDLGLLIIDEEQRFGVAHKEHLKKLREQVDVLTLSATPIPRTLHMSLVGVRDMSVIETPPENRLPIKTYVAEYNTQLVREAILRELERNGQVFFVHNRVQGIGAIAANLQSLIPEAIIDIAHGQMPEEKLEKVMRTFQNGESNVLVCTTIIESGLDMPNVNTLIVNRADKFGLTQLYQLRGRIGRGSNLAYAYFLYDKDRRLTNTAEKRLRTIFESTELGAGFGIAMKDLEIRGAGTLLGTKQSGNISAVGFNLYTQLLSRAVEEQKALGTGATKGLLPVHNPETSLDLPLKAYIPTEYISDVDLRLSMYQRLSTLASVEQVKDMAREFADRFGRIPSEVDNLLYIVKLKLLSTASGIETITTNENIVTVRLLPGRQTNRQKLMPFYRYGVKVGITQIIINLKRLAKEWPRVLEEIIQSAS
jgi:transcription-repair coupling factor (superfamily II helicase)